MADPFSVAAFPELAKAYASSFEQGDRRLMSAGDEYNTAVEADNARKAASARASAAADLTDPKAYRRVQKEDGGFDFFDPNGKQIDIATLTQRTQTNALEWINGSQNPIDIQYMNDYKNLNDFMNAVTSGDKEKADGYVKRDGMLGKYVTNPGGLNNLLEDFRTVYQRYYQPSAWGVAPNRTVVQSPVTGGYSGSIGD